MGFLDKAKKLAEQAKVVAEQAKEKAEDALAEARARTGGGGGDSAGSGASPRAGGGAGDGRFGTPYVPGMLGRPGWREEGLADPAALLPAAERDRVGIPAGTRSEVVEEPYGMGRRWTAAGRSAAVFHRVHADHRSWSPPIAWVPVTGAPAASASLPDGRELLAIEGVVLETSGIDEPERLALARAVAAQLGSA